MSWEFMGYEGQYYGKYWSGKGFIMNRSEWEQHQNLLIRLDIPQSRCLGNSDPGVLSHSIAGFLSIYSGLSCCLLSFSVSFLTPNYNVRANSRGNTPLTRKQSKETTNSSAVVSILSCSGAPARRAFELTSHLPLRATGGYTIRRLIVYLIVKFPAHPRCGHNEREWESGGILCRSDGALYCSSSAVPLAH